MRLIVMRHAHSPHGSDDHRRPLSPHGQAQARARGEALRAAGWLPDAVLSSDAQRTRDTWEQVRAALGSAPSARFLPELYLARVGGVMKLLAGVPDGTDTLLLLGHNPTVSQLIGDLCGETLPLSPSAAALLEVEAASWREAAALEGLWKLHEHLQPGPGGA